MAAESLAPTSGEYIAHHLTHAQNAKPASLVDLSVVNFDSVFFSVLLGVIGCGLMWLAARKATSGVPGRFQAAVEYLIEMVDNQAKGIVHSAHSRKLHLFNVNKDGLVIGEPLVDYEGLLGGQPALATRPN